MNDAPTRVLLIEGDEDAASLIGSYLEAGPEGRGAPVLTHAPRLSTALHLLARQEFDAALLDLALPQTGAGVDGFLKIRAMRPRLPVIVLTGRKDEAFAERAMRLGAQDCFIKGSADCGLLKRAVRHAIAAKRLSDALEDLLGEDPQARLVLDSERVVRFANPAAEKTLGRPAADIIDKPFAGAIPEDGAEAEVQAPWTREKRLVMSARPFAWRGEAAAMVTLKLALPARREGAPPAGPDVEEGVLEAKNHFLGRISHELRNTLATMKTAVYCLKESAEEKLTPQQLMMADMISRNVDRQTRLVENILDLARLRSGKLRIDLRQADAAKLISELAAEYRLSRGARTLEILVKDGLPKISCDPDLIAQVLRNLLDNAARHAKDKISISASLAGPGSVAFAVTDDGAGIPKERLETLFTLFETHEAPAGGTGGRKGTGLGLAICREIVEGHDGTIRAENAPGLGARFSFELPVVTRPSPRSDGAAMAPARPERL